MVKVYGIPNCDTVKKALQWLKTNNVEYQFHDFKKLGVSGEKLSEWSEKFGWEALLNKRGTTWKKLDTETQNAVTTEQAALNLMQEKTSVIRRPVIESATKTLLGFDESAYKDALL